MKGKVVPSTATCLPKSCSEFFCYNIFVYLYIKYDMIILYRLQVDTGEYSPKRPENIESDEEEETSADKGMTTVNCL